MSITVYQALSAAEKAYGIKVLSKGSYPGLDPAGAPPTTLGGLIALKPVTLLSFIDASDTTPSPNNQGDWLGKVDSLRTTYSDLVDSDPMFPELANILIVAVIYWPGTNLTQNQANTYVKTTRGYTDYNSTDPTKATYLPCGILYTDTWTGSMASVFRGGWAGSTPGSPTGPFSYVICRQGATTNYNVADKLHRACSYNGDDARAPDLAQMLWSGGTPATYTEARSFLYHRLAEHQQAPVMTTAPRKADNLSTGGMAGDYPHVHKGPANQILFSFSEKAVGDGTVPNYVFSTPPAGTAIAASQLAAKTAPLVWGNGTEESRTLQFDSTAIPDGTLDTVTLGAALTDASMVGFATDATVVFDSGSDTPVIEIEVVGGASHLLTDAIDPVVFPTSSPLTVNVRVRTAYPGLTQPTGSVIGPASFGGPQALSFADHAASLTVLSPGDGVYTVLVDAYVNNAGVSAGPTARSFIVASSVTAAVGSVEGASCYPREEQLPAAADPPWTSNASGATESISATGQLSVQASGTGYRSYARSYAQSFGTGPGTAAFPGSSLSYVEACLRASLAGPGYGNAVSGFDRAGVPLQVLDSGIGMEVINGPFRATLRLVEVSTDGGTTWNRNIGLKLYDENHNVWALEPADLTAADTIVRLACIRDPGDCLRYRIQFRTLGGAWAGGTVKVALAELPLSGPEPAAFSSCSVSFGRFPPSVSPYATANSNWEYVRYGFIDEQFSASLFTAATVVGIPRGQRTPAEASWRRSPDILIGTAPTASTDELVVGANSVSVNVTCAALPVPASVPYKLRVFLADWDDAPGAPLAGFSPANFIPYPFASPSAFVGRITGSVAAGATVATSPLSCPFDPHRLDRLYRRLFLFAAVDSPLLAEPLLLSGTPTASLLPADAVRTDTRYAARQFLPDFYVRDTDADLGGSPGGALSPDIAMGIFALASMADLPDPQSVNTGTARFPIGFAKGQPASSAYDPNGYQLVDSTSGNPIKITDSGWSDSATDLYSNRIWVRLSNRGIVPGPAKVQVFFLGSALRAAFNPLDPSARGAEWTRIYAQLPIANNVFLQDKFQAYDDPSTGQLSQVDAIPALSGASSEEAPTVARYVIAEFVWHVSYAAIGAISPDDAHGCRTACINLTDTAGWSSGIDEVPPLAGGDVWSATIASNNISVRNSNIVQGIPAGGSDPPYNLLALVIDNSPVNYRKAPNDFHMSFGRKPMRWGLVLRATKFPGDLILRIPADGLLADVKLVNLREVADRRVLRRAKGAPPGAFRFFQLHGPGSGMVEGFRTDGRDAPTVGLYFQPHPKAEPGQYDVVLTQMGGGRPAGEYRTVVSIPAPGRILFVADGRTGIIYDLRRYTQAGEAIPYEQRAIFTGAGLAMQEGFRLGVFDAASGKVQNEIVNLPRRYKRPPAREEMPAFAGGLEGAVIGRVVVPNLPTPPMFKVVLADRKLKRTLAEAVTDERGRYLLTIKAAGAMIPLKSAPRVVDVIVSDETGRERGHATVKAPDLCFAVDDIVVKL